MSHLPDDLARKTSVIKPSLTVFRGLGQPFIENFPALWIIRGFAFAWNMVLGFEGATPSVVKSIRQRDLLNTWLRLYAHQQKVPAIWEYQPARIEDELPDLVYCTVDASIAPPQSRSRVMVRDCRMPLAIPEKAAGSTTISAQGSRPS